MCFVGKQAIYNLQFLYFFDGDDDAPSDSMDACASRVDPDPSERAEFPRFKTLTQDQVSLMIGKAAMKSCP